MKHLIHRMSRIFDWCAKENAKTVPVVHEIGQRLIERLDYFKIAPNYILDLGAGPGFFSKLLTKRYPDAVVISLDVSLKALKGCMNQQSWRKSWPIVCADMHQLPFLDKQFDLIFANQVLHWSSPLKRVLDELHRVMKPDGCLMFSMLGPDTYKELNVLPDLELNMPRIDMHLVGDAMMSTGFGDPVLDMELLTMQHRQFDTFLDSLRRQGVRTVRKAPGLLARNVLESLQLLLSETQTKAGPYPLTYEVIYGHGWRMQDKQKTIGHETFIPIAVIQKKGAI